MSRPLHPDVLLGVHLSAICSRHRYDRDTAPVVAQLLETAGGRADILAIEAGRWAGYYGDEHTAALFAAILAEIPGAADWTARELSDGPHPHTGPRGSDPCACCHQSRSERSHWSDTAGASGRELRRP